MNKLKYFFILPVLLFFFFLTKNVYASEQFVTVNQTDLWGTFKGGGSNATIQNYFSMNGYGNENTPFTISSFNNTGVSFDYYDYIRAGIGVLYNPLNGDVTYREVVSLYFDDVLWNPSSVSFSPVMFNGNNMTAILTDTRFSNCRSIGGISYCSHFEFDMVYTWKGASVVELWLYSNGDYRLEPNSKISYRNWSFTGTTDNSDIIVNQNNTIINQNEQIINNQQETTNAINDLDDTLQNTDTTTNDITSKFGQIQEISDTPISDLLTLPLVLLNKLYNSLSSSCSPYTIPFDFSGGNNTLTFPCINLGSEIYLGRVVWGYVDDLFCIFMIYNIGKLVIWFFNGFTTLKDNFDYVMDPNSNTGGLF